ncbi:MAG: YceI family protein [Bacteroidales bacterium]
MRRFTLISLLSLIILPVISQSSYITREGSISFYSSAPLEDIDAMNNQVQAVLDASSGEIAIRMRIEYFKFRMALMQRHFNERFMNSDQYPESVFSGYINDFNELSLTDKNENVVVNGELTIRGITRSVKISGTIERVGPHLLCKATFPVRLEDYDIRIPRLLIRNIAEEVEVTVNMRLAPVD